MSDALVSIFLQCVLLCFVITVVSLMAYPTDDYSIMLIKINRRIYRNSNGEEPNFAWDFCKTLLCISYGIMIKGLKSDGFV